MKALLTNIALTLALTLIISTSLTANPLNFNEEEYIDDIPFNTEEIVADIIAEQELASFTYEEEEYIDDIPFDTECISAQCKYQKAISVEFNFEEEQFIDDIEL